MFSASGSHQKLQFLYYKHHTLLTCGPMMPSTVTIGTVNLYGWQSLPYPRYTAEHSQWAPSCMSLHKVLQNLCAFTLTPTQLMRGSMHAVTDWTVQTNTRAAAGPAAST